MKQTELIPEKTDIHEAEENLKVQKIECSQRHQKTHNMDMKQNPYDEKEKNTLKLK